MKKLIIILLLFGSISVHAQVDSSAVYPTIEKTNVSTRKVRRANPAFKESRKQNVRTHITCSTIFTTCLLVWFNVDKISEKVRPDLYE